MWNGLFAPVDILPVEKQEWPIGPFFSIKLLERPAARDGGIYVDATFGGGGYSRAMLEQPSAGSRRSTATLTPWYAGGAGWSEHPGFTIVHAPFGEMRSALAARRRRPGRRHRLRPRRLVLPARPERARLLLSERRAAGHAHGRDAAHGRRPRQRTGRGRADAAAVRATATSRRHGAVARAIVAARRRAPITTTGALAAHRRHGPRAVARVPGTRRRGRFRRCGSRSMTRSANSNAVWRPPRPCCGRAVGWSWCRSIPARTPWSRASSTSTVAARRSRRGICRRSICPPPRWRWVRQGVIKPSGQPRSPPTPAHARRGCGSPNACRRRTPACRGGGRSNGGSPREPRLSRLLGAAGGRRGSGDLPAEVRGP